MSNPKGDQGSGAGLDREQWMNAVVIYQVGTKLGASPRDIQIALITAMQESGLRNVDYGDRDSLGLFQQRPSMSWGSPEQVRNPEYAAQAFFKGAGTNKGLLDIGNRASMPLWAAAQEVQRSAYPTAYKKHIPLVQSIWPVVQQRGGNAPTSMDGGAYGLPQVTNTFAAGMKPGTVQPMDTSGMADYLLGAGMPSMLGAAEFGTDGMPDEDYEMFTTPLRPMAPDEFATIRGGYTKGLDGWRNGVVELARQMIGTPYEWGGTTINGVDCSGLLQLIFGKVGHDLPRVSYQQANFGTRAKIKNLSPGDLVAWDNSTRNAGADHIALYIGNGQIIEAPRTGLSVRVRKLGADEGAWGVKLDF